MVKAKKAPPTVEERLHRLARNLWWSWNPHATALFASMDPPLFTATNQNPVKTLRMLSPERRRWISTDPGFARRLAEAEAELSAYLAAPTWFSSLKLPGKPLVAYFCAEFAVHESLPQYSGGLGVLAGDHVKAASDLGIPLVGVGLLYRCGFYTQQFAPDGSTVVIYPELDFADLPISPTGVTVTVPIRNRKVKAAIWQQVVGRTTLYLLDTDLPANRPADRKLTHHLYGGDGEYRILQEMLLGVGGVLALQALKLRPTVYHLNEGHAAFAPLERVRQLVASGVKLEKAIEQVRANSVFTTHTPVPAGNDRFDAKLTMKYLSGYAKALGLGREGLLGLGREVPSDKAEPFCMTVLALKLAKYANGVSKLHGEVSREMWKRTFGKPTGEGVPIGSVTNGVHLETWLAPEIRPLYAKYLKPKWLGAGPMLTFFKNATKIPDGELWKMRRVLKQKLIRFARQRLIDQCLRRGGDPRELAIAQSALDENAMFIGFARRFATYKRAPLIFRDVKRLAKILGNPEKPVNILFAGKAHPKDMGGQAFAAEIFRHALSDTFAGKVVLIEDYDMNVGRYLYGGCDVWLNNPLRPQEASGTSGMKPPLHGGLNFSILDGWWPEGWDGQNGWAIGDGSQLEDLEKQNAKDAEEIYRTLETEIVPLYFQRNSDGVPVEWLQRARHAMATIPPAFSTHRMLGDYWKQYYSPAHAG
ncbi:MAG: alpha-glucan family phosphorylase [Tepidisphaerales bacterium]